MTTDPLRRRVKRIEVTYGDSGDSYDIVAVKFYFTDDGEPYSSDDFQLSTKVIMVGIEGRIDRLNARFAEESERQANR